MGVFQQPANSPNVWCYIEWLWVVLNIYLLLLWKATHTIKKTAFESFGNPTVVEGQGWLPLFLQLQRQQGGLAVFIV